MNLVDFCKEFFQGSVSLKKDMLGNPTPKELQLATVVLLLEMASIDGEVSDEEVSSIISSLDAQFALNEAEAIKLIMAGYQEHERKGIIERFIEELNQAFSVKQKQVVMSLVYAVVNADGIVTKEEKDLFEIFQAAFSLSDSEVAEAMALVTSKNQATAKNTEN